MILGKTLEEEEKKPCVSYFSTGVCTWRYGKEKCSYSHDKSLYNQDYPCHLYIATMGVCPYKKCYFKHDVRFLRNEKDSVETLKKKYENINTKICHLRRNIIYDSQILNELKSRKRSIDDEHFLEHQTMSRKLEKIRDENLQKKKLISDNQERINSLYKEISSTNKF
jgi:flagellar biosynthesis regulator FlbT